MTRARVIAGLAATAWALASLSFAQAPSPPATVQATPGPADAIVTAHPSDATALAPGAVVYSTVQAAIDAVPQNTTAARRWMILVLPGTYHERLYVQREKRFVSLVGADPLRTAIEFDAKASDIGPDARPIGTYRTPTVTIDADDFAIENLTIANTSGPGSQALALRVDGDRLVVRNSRLLGWQDTLFVDRGRQYFEDSLIAGHVDFIFGGATAYFERCRLHAWADGYLTAASTPPESRFGFVFDRATITGASPGVRTYLGRPWRGDAQVTWLRSVMSSAVRAEGWHDWDHPERQATMRYEEYASEGPGAAGPRVSWAHPLTPAAAEAYTVTNVLGGADRWDPRAVRAYPSAVRALDEASPSPPGPGEVAR